MLPPHGGGLPFIGGGDMLVLIMLRLLLAHYAFMTCAVSIDALLLTDQLLMIMSKILKNPGYRSDFFAPLIWNKNFYPTVKQMMKPESEGGNPEQFRRYFRMMPDTFVWFRDRLWRHVHGDPGGKRKRGRPVSSELFEKRLLMTIWFLAHSCTYMTLSAVWGQGLSHRDLLIDEIASMQSTFIAWPQGADFDAAKREFEKLIGRDSLQKAGFPNICGAIDGTFIRIRRPMAAAMQAGLSDDVFNTYKRFYAIQLLLVCLPNFVITYAYAGQPGSRADAWVLKQCDLYKNLYKYIPAGLGAYLIGDAGFPLLTWLVTPFWGKVMKCQPLRKARLNAFNTAQQSARVVIEQTNGILKGRWRCLQHGLHCDLERAPNTVMACVILHNVCIRRNDIWPHPPVRSPTGERTAAHDADSFSALAHDTLAGRAGLADGDVGVRVRPAWLEDEGEWAPEPATAQEIQGWGGVAAKSHREMLLSALISYPNPSA
jgi:hypothetical protein